MTRIPNALQLLQSGSPKDLQALLIAAILHTEDEMLVITESELSAARNYTLVTTVITEENNSVVLTTRPK